MKHFSLPSFRRYWKYGVLELIRHPTRQFNWERFLQFTVEMVFYGFTSADTWSVDCCIVDFALPRLRMFQDYLGGSPMNMEAEQWYKTVAKIVKGLELYQKDRCGGAVLTEKEKKKMEKGMKLFFEYFGHLWN